jgi:hypothetical protein
MVTWWLAMSLVPSWRRCSRGLSGGSRSASAMRGCSDWNDAAAIGENRALTLAIAMASARESRSFRGWTSSPLSRRNWTSAVSLFTSSMTASCRSACRCRVQK